LQIKAIKHTKTGNKTNKRKRRALLFSAGAVLMKRGGRFFILINGGVSSSSKAGARMQTVSLYIIYNNVGKRPRPRLGLFPLPLGGVSLSGRANYQQRPRRARAAAVSSS